MSPEIVARAEAKPIAASGADHEAGVRYGCLLEGTHIAGYAFERALDNLEWLLQADRWRNVGGRHHSSIDDFLESISFRELRPVAEQRRKIVALIKGAQPAASNRKIAKAVGVDEITVRRDAANVAASSKAANEINGAINAAATNVAPPIGGRRAAKLVKAREARKAREIESERQRMLIPSPCGGSAILHARDFRSAAGEFSRVDAIITDPPYGGGALPLLRDLAEFATKALKPGGVLAVLCGQTHLQEAFAAMAGFVPYRWTACYLTRKSGYVSHDRRVLAHWKPLVIYGGDKQSERFCDVIESTENDTGGKERHPWGQSFSDFVEIIERLTRRGGTIVDPFCGGGTTLLAARACGRHGIGFEIDAAVAAKTQELLRRAFEDVGA